MLALEEVLEDSLYGSDENLEKAGEMAVDVLAPALGAPKEGSLSLAHFPQSEKRRIMACPRGHAPGKYKEGKKGVYSIAFASEDCSVCPLRDPCPVKPRRKHHYLRFHYKALGLAGRRAREHTSGFRDKYCWRSRIEATFPEMGRKTGIKRLRIRGLSAVGYCARLKAIGVNIFRAARVKRAIDALKAAPGSGFPGICSAFSAVKELFLSQWHRLSHIFHPAVQHQLCIAIIAA